MNLEERLAQQWGQDDTILVPQLPEQNYGESEPGSSIPVLDVVPEFAITLTEAKERIFMLQSFVKDMMVEGVDFGSIPGCSKPSLFKPGAEKLCDIFGFSKQVEVTHRIEDWDKGVFAYEVKVILTNKRTGLMEAEGIGSCNSMERKYKQQEAFSLANTILKMSKKRALVDAVLSATRSSGLFTQDIEDLEMGKSKNQGKLPTDNRKDKPRMATEPQLNKIYLLAKNRGLSVKACKQLLKDLYQVDKSTQLTISQASDFIKHLMELEG